MSDECARCKKLEAELTDLRLTMRVGGDALRAFTRAGRPAYPQERQEWAELDAAVKKAKRGAPVGPLPVPTDPALVSA